MSSPFLLPNLFPQDLQNFSLPEEETESGTKPEEVEDICIFLVDSGPPPKREESDEDWGIFCPFPHH